MPRMTDNELAALINREERDAVHFSWGEISAQRENALAYYLQGEYEGDTYLKDNNRSTYVTSEVYDVVEGAIPSLLKIFLGSDKIVQFAPVGPEDDAVADQATDAVEYVATKQNNAMQYVYTSLKDGLLSKTGQVMWYWDENIQYEEKTYEGLSELELLMLLVDPMTGQPKPDIEVIEHNIEGTGPAPDVMMGMQPAATHSVKLKCKKDYSKVCIKPIAPEELIVSREHNSLLLEDCPFVEYIREMTRTDLKNMGFTDADLEGASREPDWLEFTGERSQRRSLEGGYDARTADNNDPAMDVFWVSSIWLLVDYDGDGVAERRYVLKVGNKVIANEPTDHVPIAMWSPIPMTHRVYGLSLADKTMDLQFLNSQIFRSVLDNAYLSNDAQMIVTSSRDGELQANIDDLLNRRPGGVIREYTGGAIRPLEVPFYAHQMMPWLEYVRTMQENRTGITRYNQGLDADTLNKTATGMSLLQNQSNMRLEVIARLYAEFLLKPLFRGVLRLLSKNYSKTKPLMVRLRNQWVDMDPSNWRTEMDVTVNVGIGTGDKQQQLMHLNAIAQWQTAAMKMGYALPYEAFRETMSRMTENAGFKETEKFWPEQIQSQQQSDPRAQMIQQEAQLKAQALQQEAGLKTQEMQLDAQMEKYKADLKAQTDLQIAAMKQEMEAQKAAVQAMLRSVQPQQPTAPV